MFCQVLQTLLHHVLIEFEVLLTPEFHQHRQKIQQVLNQPQFLSCIPLSFLLQRGQTRLSITSLSHRTVNKLEVTLQTKNLSKTILFGGTTVIFFQALSILFVYVCWGLGYLRGVLEDLSQGAELNGRHFNLTVIYFIRYTQKIY